MMETSRTRLKFRLLALMTGVSPYIRKITNMNKVTTKNNPITIRMARVTAEFV